MSVIVDKLNLKDGQTMFEDTFTKIDNNFEKIANEINGQVSLVELKEENIKAEANITAMESFGDVSTLSQEVTTARNGEVNLDTRIDKIDNKIGDLSTLTTTDKTSLVNSIKELVAQSLEKAKQTDLNTTNANLSQLSNPNLLINSRFKIRQRGDTFSYGAFNPKYTFDRWYIFSGNASSGLVATEDSSEYVRFIGTSTGQILENLELGTYTLTALVRSNSVQNFAMNIENANSISDRSLISSYKVDIGTTWTKISYTFSLTIKSKTYISIALGLTTTGATSQFDIKWVKLELGSIATPFVPRHYGEELALCMRYYQFYLPTGVASTSSVVHCSNVLPVKMRVTPTTSIQDNRAFTNGTGTVDNGTASVVVADYIVSYISFTGTSLVIGRPYSLATGLKLDAEIY